MTFPITGSVTGGRPLVSYDEEKVTALSSELILACERLRELGQLPREVFTKAGCSSPGRSYETNRDGE